jgi:CheY-like chemotaxis protein
VARNIFELAHATDVESLGTCVIASVARAHGGRISLRSQQGTGNAFLVELPMVEPAQSPVPEVSLQGTRVLVVDDEEFLLECLVDAMTSWGCRTMSCSQGAEAIEKLQQEAFDLIVSDIRMPGLSGIELYQWIQANQPLMARRILFTTGDTFDPETRAFLEDQRVPHLGKPFDLRKLRQGLNDLLASVK